MKQYFAKYLPVEGEIKEGDPYFSRGILFKKYQNLSTNILYGKKLAKLFLCSRDVEVGDKIIADYTIDGTSEGLGINHVQKEGTVNKEEFGDHWEVSTARGIEYAWKDGCFKVMGEISSGALSYVKEGQEFDEDDWTYQKPGYGVDASDLKPIYRIVKIKCNMGHFH